MIAETRRVDVRALPPCEPMEQILVCLDRLGRGQRLRALLDREPVFLYPILRERGFQWRGLADDGGRFELLIWQADGGDRPE